MKAESTLMAFFRRLGMDRIAWSLRRLHCPVGKNDLVLEVGSGGNPYWRANVLCDAYLETSERHFEPLIQDRPMVLAFTEDLPFKDDSFDFVIASHVLEHSTDPERFLSEIQRVGRAGYIEVPDAFFERLANYSFHRLEITDRDNALIIRKKSAYIQDADLYELCGRKTGRFIYNWVNRNPFEFHVRFYWSRATGGIKYKIVNPDYVFDWTPLGKEKNTPRPSLMARFKTICLHMFRSLLSQKGRNRRIRVEDFLWCPQCRCSRLETTAVEITCADCRAEFPVHQGGVADFTRTK